MQSLSPRHVMPEEALRLRPRTYALSWGIGALVGALPLSVLGLTCHSPLRAHFDKAYHDEAFSG